MFLKELYNKTKTFFVGYRRDASQALNTAESVDDFKEKNGKAFFKNIELAFGRKGFKFLIISWVLTPALVFGYSLIKDDFQLLRNISYSITADSVIEETIKEKDGEIAEFEKEMAILEAKYEELQENYLNLVKNKDADDEQMQQLIEQLMDLQQQLKELRKENGTS